MSTVPIYSTQYSVMLHSAGSQQANHKQLNHIRPLFHLPNEPVQIKDGTKYLIEI